METEVQLRPVEAVEPSGAQSIERAAGLLRILGSARDRGASLTELVEASGLAKPTCRRILLALIGAGLAEQDLSTHRYFLGPEAYVLGAVAALRYGLHRVAYDSVCRLAAETGDAAFLQVRRQWSVVCVQREEGDYPIRSHVLAPGDRYPLGTSVAGITILAAQPDDEVEAAIAANAAVLAERFPAFTRTRILDLVSEARTLGYGINRGLLFPGSWGMGVALHDEHGRPEACLSIAAIESRLQPDRQRMIAQLLNEEVRRVEGRLKELGRPAAAPQRRLGRRK